MWRRSRCTILKRREACSRCNNSNAIIFAIYYKYITSLNLYQTHKEDTRGKIERNWLKYHAWWITMWNNRHNHLIEVSISSKTTI